MAVEIDFAAHSGERDPSGADSRTGAGDALDEAAFAGAARAVLDAVASADAELSVTIVSDAAIAELNHRWRGKQRPTDVLSFPAGEAPRIDGSPRLLGDVVISLDTARRQAADGGWTLLEEATRLLLHGVLHLLGFDHEAGAAEAERMSAEERRVVAALRAAGHPCAADDGGD